MIISDSKYLCIFQILVCSWNMKLCLVFAAMSGSNVHGTHKPRLSNIFTNMQLH